MHLVTTNFRENQRIGRTSFHAVALLVLFGFCCHSARAQSAASLSGLVTDPQHAAVADAPVKITNPATRQTYNVRTDAQGSYDVNGFPY